MAYPRYQLSRQFKKIQRASTSFSVNSIVWSEISSALRLTVDAQVGDTLEYGVNFLIGNENSYCSIDVATVVSSTLTNYAAQPGGPLAANNGMPGWQGLPGSLGFTSGTYLYTVQSGDLDTNNRVTVTLASCNSSTTAKTIYATTGNPFLFYVKNLGPSDDD